MRALLIAPIHPSIIGNGLAMRTALFAEALARIAELDILIVPLAGESFRKSDFPTNGRLMTLPLRAETPFRLIMQIALEDRRLDAFHAYAKPSLGAFLSQPIVDEVCRLASTRSYDLIHVTRSYMMALADAFPIRALMTADLDEDDFGSMLSRSRLTRRMDKEFESRWFEAEAIAFDKTIAKYRNRFSQFFVSSRNDGATLAGRHPGLRSTLCANAVVAPPAFMRCDDGCTFIFVGSLGYRPNVDGLLWFVEKVAPRISAQFSGGFSLLIAGRDAPQEIANLALRPRIKLLRNVSHIEEVYRRATVAIAPMRMGGGTRIKIVEAGMHGIACVTHDASAGNLPLGLLRGGWQAANEKQFARACVEALTNGAERRRRERTAREFSIRTYDRQKIVSFLADEFRMLTAIKEAKPDGSIFLGTKGSARAS